jgi:AraC-like DNA-binding protein
LSFCDACSTLCAAFGRARKRSQGADTADESSASDAIAEGLVRVDAVAAIPRLLREHRVDPDAFLAEFGLAPAHFDDPRNAMDFTLLGHLLERAAARTGCAHFGLLVGREIRPDGLGIAGLLARNSPDVRMALHNLARYLHLRDRGGIATLAAEGGVARLGYAIYHHGVEGSDQILDGSIAMGFQLMRRLCGPTWRPSQVSFAHRRPRDTLPFRRLFGAPLRFDAERSELVFPASCLARRCAGADPRAYEALARRAAALASGNGHDLAGELRRLLRALLIEGSDSVASAAEQLALHRRTLNRRLRALGTSVRRLDQEVRFEAARQLVEHTEMPLVDVGNALGYGDASAFTRAFRRWSGMAPAAWRQARRGAGNPDAGARPAAARAAPSPESVVK